MGDVYVAHDTTLDRRVALKLPRPDVAATADRLALFRREARAAAALNHANIVHLYSVEEADGLIFMTMELVEGRSLRDLLVDGAPLPLPRALAFACQIAEGLKCAHDAGVLHRDLKPGNVMITSENQVKILDFGVAKFFRRDSTWDPEGTTTVRDASTTGATVGTIGYMSPEQARGEALDARTDLFALGVMLFEMTTGRLPFEGETPAVVFDRLLNRDHASPLAVNPAMPPSLAAIIDKALEKDPHRRYRSPGELLDDLRAVPVAESRQGTVRAVQRDARPSSIVVLPFADMSPRRDQEYFCHGISEEIITTLASVPGLHVISRTSAFAFQDTHLDITEIGRRLRVGTALEGSVRKAGDRVRVTAQLVDTANGYQLWSRRFDRELSDVFAIQDEIAAAIVSEFRMVLAGQPSSTRTVVEVKAHDAYLKGIYARNKWTADAMRRAIADFREAIAEDAGFAPAYAALGEAYLWLYSGVGILPASDTVPESRWAVEKALELDPGLADAHRIRALIAMNHDWDRQGAKAALARALQLGPASAAVHLSNGWRLAVVERRHAEALIELEEAERLDPLDLRTKTLIGYVHHFHHDIDRAIDQFEKVVALEPSFGFAHYALGDACIQRREYDRAFAELGKSIELDGRTVNHVAVLGYASGRAGDAERAKTHLEELTARAAQGYVPAMWIALVYLGLSDLENTFRWLDRAFEERDGSLILIAAAVEFDPVREDPRFKSLVRKMGLTPLASAPT